MRKCWDANAEKRPEMGEVVKMLEAIDTSKGGGMIPEDQAAGCFCFSPVRGPWYTDLHALDEANDLEVLNYLPAGCFKHDSVVYMAKG